MLRRCIPLLLALTLALTACTPQGGPQETAASPSPTPSPTETVRPAPTPRPTQTAEPGPDLSLDGEHRLDRDYDPVPAGQLELPVRGATGYASVELGLWPEPQPEPEPEPSATPQPSAGPSPSPSAQPSAEPEPAPSPTAAPETASPAPAETPAESVSPSDSSPAPAPPPEETGAVESVPPAQESAAPTAQPTAAPTPSPTPSPAPSTTPAPAEPPAVSASPAPSPTPSADPFEGALAVLEPGSAFTVLKEDGDWWQVRWRGTTGWVEHRYCMINLPDVVPSILYDATNSYDSLYRSAGKALPGVTGESLYPGMEYNPRLGRSEFMMPVLYAMAYKICEAQQAALMEGNCLVLYEGYRPYATQRAVVKALTALINSDPEVEAAVNSGPWGAGNFIAMGYSNHQRGFAIDVSLAKVWSTREESISGHTYLQVVDYDLYEMPTPMHELSSAAVTFTRPTGAWRTADPAPGMNEPAFALQRYCTGAGMTPLSSEWWHFNDYAARDLAADHLGTGGFQITACVSTAP